MWIQRDLADIFLKTAGERPIILLTGARQTGKTSLAKDVFPQHKFVSLDLPPLAEEAEHSGAEFLARSGTPAIFDEVQYAPKLFRYLKRAVDARRGETGLYVLTGSQKFSLMEGVSESLAGRVAVLDLYSLSFKELERSSGKAAESRQLLEWIFLGGYPELHAKQLDPERFFADYVVTYLERDVRQVLQVKSLRDFNRFMRLAALRTGQMLSLHAFASDIGVSPNTIKSWLSVLEASQIICILEPYYRNLGKRLVKTPKLYFLDTGLAAFLCGLRNVEDLSKSALLGAFFETAVLGQMIRWHGARGKRPSIYFYRDHNGAEVDFVIPVGDKLKLYECKYSEMPPAIPAFQALTEAVGKKNVISKSIVTPTRGLRKREDGVIIEDCVEFKSLES